MIAALICLASLAALLQFFVAYCRLVLASTAKIELSQHVRQVAGVDGKAVCGDDFERFMELARICPERESGHVRFRAIEAYYNLLSTLSRAPRGILPGLAAWAEHEQGNCSYFAAVALDRRISLNRGLGLEGGLRSF
jgi:hypothetical protein